MTRPKYTISTQSQAFICEHCSTGVLPPEFGTSHRNHCPRCLWSRHVDLRTGDRMSVCRGLMEPIGVWVTHNNEWSLIHRCVKCGYIRTNRIAGDDNPELLMELACRPLRYPAFPHAEHHECGTQRRQEGGTR